MLLRVGTCRVVLAMSRHGQHDAEADAVAAAAPAELAPAALLTLLDWQRFVLNWASATRARSSNLVGSPL